MSERNDVIAEVKRLAQSAADPVLSDPEVGEIVDKHLSVGAWVAVTAYAFGDVIRPTSRNGHRYRVVTAGTSGATEPTWNTPDYSLTSDGSVLWEEDGADASSSYDINAAVSEAWRQKAAKATEYFGKDEQGIYARCIEMSERYAPVVIA